MRFFGQRTVSCCNCLALSFMVLVYVPTGGSSDNKTTEVPTTQTARSSTLPTNLTMKSPATTSNITSSTVKVSVTPVSTANLSKGTETKTTEEAMPRPPAKITSTTLPPTNHSTPPHPEKSDISGKDLDNRVKQALKKLPKNRNTFQHLLDFACGPTMVRCQMFATCVSHQSGKFKCVCKEGYRKSGKNCLKQKGTSAAPTTVALTTSTDETVPGEKSQNPGKASSPKAQAPVETTKTRNIPDSVVHKEMASGSGHFAVVFLVMIALLFGLYALYHNRQRIIAVVIEGRSSHGRRGERERYRKLETNGEEPQARIKNSSEVYVY